MLESLIKNVFCGLHKTQGINHISVNFEEQTYDVPVYIKIRNHRMKSTEVKFFKAIGLNMEMKG